MKKLLTVSLVALGLVFAPYSAQAGGKHHGGHNHHYAGKGHHGIKKHHRAYKKHRHWHGHKHKHRSHARRYAKHHHKHYKHYKQPKYDDIGDEILIGSAIIGGSIVAHGLITQSADGSPSRHDASPHAPFCEQTDVYRYLPDGRVQWGVRTRCH